MTRAVEPRRSGTARVDDERILGWFDLRDQEGMSLGGIARACGTTRNTVVAALGRVRREPAVPCACLKRENRDGGMPRGWWRG